jgi:3-hydroxyacyl-[acyl-carrier-protein] dehydratase
MSDTQTTAVAENPATEASTIIVGKTTLDVGEIMSIIPHRYPFLLIDRVIDIERKKRIVATKNVTINEPQFQGHFPDYPIMPAVMTVESMAQAGATLLLTEYTLEERENKLMVFTGIEKARFRRPIVPGDQVRFEVTVLNWRSNAVKMHGVATVEGKLAAEATFLAALVPRPKKDSAPVAKPGPVPSANPAAE